MAFQTELQESGLHLVSGDLPGLASRLVEAEQQHRTDRSWAVVDLSGEQWLAGRSCLQPITCLHSYEAVPFALRLWTELQPRLEPWLQLLELQNPGPLLAPPLPGVDALLRCLFLAEALDQGLPLTVLLPGPAEAAALLELGRTGPALVETLLEPLLLWWDQIRQSLSSLELVLRLRLPPSSSLRLNPRWRQRLDRLAQALGADGGWHYSLMLEAGQAEDPVLRQRLAAAALRGCLPTRLALHGSGAEAFQTDPPEWWPLQLPCLALEADADGEALTALLRLGAPAPPGWLRPEASTGCDRCVLPLPGLRKRELEIQQIGSVLVLIALGHRRLIELPPAMEGRVCSGARLEAGWLELRFG